MCVMRHSAARPRNRPSVRINLPWRQPFCDLRMTPPIELLQLSCVDAWTREIAANENELVSCAGLWRRFIQALFWGTCRALDAVANGTKQPHG
jgi:hypothetical protein